MALRRRERPSKKLTRKVMEQVGVHDAMLVPAGTVPGPSLFRSHEVHDRCHNLELTCRSAERDSSGAFVDGIGHASRSIAGMQGPSLDRFRRWRRGGHAGQALVLTTLEFGRSEIERECKKLGARKSGKSLWV